MEPGTSYDANNFPELEVLQLKPASEIGSFLHKGADYVATCRHQDEIFDFPIYLPDEIKRHQVLINLQNKSKNWF